MRSGNVLVTASVVSDSIDSSAAEQGPLEKATKLVAAADVVAALDRLR